MHLALCSFFCFSFSRWDEFHNFSVQNRNNLNPIRLKCFHLKRSNRISCSNNILLAFVTYLRESQVNRGSFADINDLAVWCDHENETVECLQKSEGKKTE